MSEYDFDTLASLISFESHGYTIQKSQGERVSCTAGRKPKRDNCGACGRSLAIAAARP